MYDYYVFIRYMEQETSFLSTLTSYVNYLKLYINELISITKKNIPLLVVVLVSIFVVYQFHVASNDEYASTQNLLTYVFTIVVPIIAIFAYIVFVSFDRKVMSYILGGAGITLVVFGIIFWLFNSFLTKYIFNKYLLYTVYALLAIVLLSIAYNVFKKYLIKMSGWIGLLANLVFYIPCLLTDFMKYVMGDYYSTPRSTLILVGVELGLLAFYFYILPFVRNTINSGAYPLLKEPKFLDKYVEIDRELKKERINQVKDPSGSGEMSYRTGYALSMWVYVNPMPPNREAYSKETTIFSYSSNNRKGHPTLTYKNDEGEDMFFLYFSSDGEPYKIQLPKQKWNHVVFNYRSNSVDVFINGKIERSYTFSKNALPQYSDTDVISIGPKKGEDGLYGSISNILYYPFVLSKSQITTHYNLNFTKNPPIYE